MRYHGLDLLRAAMMFLVVILHVGVMYMPLPDEKDIVTIAEEQRDPFRDVGGYNISAQRIV